MTPRRDESGAVALEAMLVLPLVVVLLGAVVASSSVVVDQLAVTRAARAAARAVSLTGDTAAARSVAGQVRPGAVVGVQVRRGVVGVTVTGRSSLLGVAYEVDATAVAPLEPVVDRR